MFIIEVNGLWYASGPHAGKTILAVGSTKQQAVETWLETRDNMESLLAQAKERGLK